MKKKIIALLLSVVTVALAAGVFATGGVAGGTAGGSTGGVTGGVTGGSSGIGNSARDGFAEGAEGDAGDTVIPDNSIPGDQTNTSDGLTDGTSDAEGNANNRTNWGGIVIAILLAIGLIAVVVVIVPKRRR